MLRLPRKVTHELHQMLRLPPKMNLMIDPHHKRNLIYNARSNRHHPPTSPNTAPATQNESHDWSASHMKRHLQCAEQQSTPSNLTKYCACHAKWISWLMHITFEASFTMRGATGINFQPHQILRLPRKIALPNLREIYWKQLKWHFQCATDPSMIREHPTMIRPWSDPENAKLNPPRSQGYFSHSPGADYNVSRSGYHSKFHHMLRLPRKVTHEPHQMLHLPQKVRHELHQMLHLPQKVTLELHVMLHLPQKVTHELHEMLHLPQKVTHELHEMLPQKVTHELLLVLLLLVLLLLLLLLLLRLLRTTTATTTTATRTTTSRTTTTRTTTTTTRTTTTRTTTTRTTTTTTTRTTTTRTTTTTTRTTTTRTTTTRTTATRTTTTTTLLRLLLLGLLFLSGYPKVRISEVCH